MLQQVPATWGTAPTTSPIKCTLAELTGEARISTLGCKAQSGSDIHLVAKVSNCYRSPVVLCHTLSTRRKRRRFRAVGYAVHNGSGEPACGEVIDYECVERCVYSIVFYRRCLRWREWCCVSQGVFALSTTTVERQRKSKSIQNMLLLIPIHSQSASKPFL